MTKPKKPRVPKDAEVKKLYNLVFDSCLFQAHGIIVHNVLGALHELLTELGRPDLAALAIDQGALTDATRDTGPRPS